MHFEKVSTGTMYSAMIDIFDTGERFPDEFHAIYDNIRIPKQGSAASAGMDFFAPYDFTLKAGCETLIPTGIRWVTGNTERDRVLLMLPRSGMGFKTGMRLMNTVGVIDADYCDVENEGHIILKIYNPSDKNIEVKAGKAFSQGIIVPFMICEGSQSDAERTGGFGSTDSREENQEDDFSLEEDSADIDAANDAIERFARFLCDTLKKQAEEEHNLAETDAKTGIWGVVRVD